ncbi:MAG: hypothetical protein WCP35_07450 [Verrucomicrobiota bacterium]
MTTQAFPFILLGGCILGCIMFLLGQYNGYFRGISDGFHDGYQAAHDDFPECGDLDDIRWQLAVPSSPTALPTRSDLSEI